MPAPKTRKPPPAPTDTSLHEAALAHLARFATSQAGLARVLERRVNRWARASNADADTIEAHAAAAHAAIAAIVARLVASGALSDAAFAVARARSLARAGRSRRAIGAHLANRGVPSGLAAAAAPEDPQRELAAALIHTRRRRMGPWRAAAATPEINRRELASLARAGYAHAIARRALSMDTEEAEGAIVQFRANL